VQGVGFRWRLREEAQRLGLAGWVRNRHDGTVEVLAEGEPEALRGLEAWLASPQAPGHVDRVRAEDRVPEQRAVFDIRPSAH